MCAASATYLLVHTSFEGFEFSFAHASFDLGVSLEDALSVCGSLWWLWTGSNER